MVAMNVRIAVASILAAALAGCDARAKATEPRGDRAEVKSREYESCGASMDCEDELRCLGQVCRRATRSTVGDYYAALGALHRTNGELDLSIDAYNKALGHYETEKLAAPPDVDCAFGATLAAARSKKEHAELGARVLHRCILSVPHGSELRTAALANLALLDQAGLDPLAVGRAQLADAYLTRAPQKPSNDKAQVSVAASPAVDKKTFPLVTERLGQPDVRSAILACWEAYASVAKKDALVVTVGLKWQFFPSGYDDEPDRFAPKLEPAAGVPAGADAAADACVRGAIEPPLKALTSVRDAFSTSLTITVR